MKNALRLSIAMFLVASSFPKISKVLDGPGSGGPCPPGAVCNFDQNAR